MLDMQGHWRIYNGKGVEVQMSLPDPQAPAQARQRRGKSIELSAEQLR